MTKHPQDNFRVAVKVELFRRRLTVTEFARQLGKARNTVSISIHHAVNPKLRQRIAAELGLEVQP